MDCVLINLCNTVAWCRTFKLEELRAKNRDLFRRSAPEKLMYDLKIKYYVST